VLSQLGLGGFSSGQLQAIKASCVEIIPVKKILAKAEVWRWPLDHLLWFSLGLELVLVGVFFRPIADWIGAGGTWTGWRQIRDAAQRFVASMRNLRAGNFVSVADTAWRSIFEAADRLVMSAATVIRSKFAADFWWREGTGARAFERLRVLSSRRFPRAGDDGGSRPG
jgi:hypothetical protein